MSQEKARKLYVRITEDPVFLSCTPREGGDGAMLRVEGRLSVHIAAPEDKISCTLGKQRDWPPSVQKSLRFVPNLYMTCSFKVWGY